MQDVVIACLVLHYAKCLSQRAKQLKSMFKLVTDVQTIMYACPTAVLFQVFGAFSF